MSLLKNISSSLSEDSREFLNILLKEVKSNSDINDVDKKSSSSKKLSSSKKTSLSKKSNREKTTSHTQVEIIKPRQINRNGFSRKGKKIKCVKISNKYVIEINQKDLNILSLSIDLNSFNSKINNLKPKLNIPEDNNEKIDYKKIHRKEFNLLELLFSIQELINKTAQQCIEFQFTSILMKNIHPVISIISNYLYIIYNKSLSNINHFINETSDDETSVEELLELIYKTYNFLYTNLNNYIFLAPLIDCILSKYDFIKTNLKYIDIDVCGYNLNFGKYLISLKIKQNIVNNILEQKFNEHIKINLSAFQLFDTRMSIKIPLLFKTFTSALRKEFNNYYYNYKYTKIGNKLLLLVYYIDKIKALYETEDFKTEIKDNIIQNFRDCKDKLLGIFTIEKLKKIKIKNILDIHYIDMNTYNEIDNTLQNVNLLKSIFDLFEKLNNSIIKKSKTIFKKQKTIKINNSFYTDKNIKTIIPIENSEQNVKFDDVGKNNLNNLLPSSKKSKSESSSELFTNKNYNNIQKKITESEQRNKLKELILKNIEEIRNRTSHKNILLNVNEVSNDTKYFDSIINDFTIDEINKLLKTNNFVNEFVEFKVSKIKNAHVRSNMIGMPPIYNESSVSPLYHSHISLTNSGYQSPRSSLGSISTRSSLQPKRSISSLQSEQSNYSSSHSNDLSSHSNDLSSSSKINTKKLSNKDYKKYKNLLKREKAAQNIKTKLNERGVKQVS